MNEYSIKFHSTSWNYSFDTFGRNDTSLKEENEKKIRTSSTLLNFRTIWIFRQLSKSVFFQSNSPLRHQSFRLTPSWKESNLQTENHVNSNLKMNQTPSTSKKVRSIRTVKQGTKSRDFESSMFMQN